MPVFIILLIAVKIFAKSNRKNAITVMSHGCYSVSDHGNLNFSLNSLSRLSTKTSQIVGVAGPLWEEFTFGPWTPTGLMMRNVFFYAMTSAWCHNMRWWCGCSYYPIPNWHHKIATSFVNRDWPWLGYEWVITYVIHVWCSFTSNA